MQHWNLCPCSKGRRKQGGDRDLSLVLPKVDSLETQTRRADFLHKWHASRERLLFRFALIKAEPAPEEIRAVKGTWATSKG